MPTKAQKNGFEESMTKPLGLPAERSYREANARARARYVRVRVREHTAEARAMKGQ